MWTKVRVQRSGISDHAAGIRGKSLGGNAIYPREKGEHLQCPFNHQMFFFSIRGPCWVCIILRHVIFRGIRMGP